jgi:hypothetical protein
MALNKQVQTLVDNYVAAQENAAAARKANLEARKAVRDLRGTIETLVEYGVVSESILGSEDDEVADNGDE